MWSQTSTNDREWADPDAHNTVLQTVHIPCLYQHTSWPTLGVVRFWQQKSKLICPGPVMQAPNPHNQLFVSGTSCKLQRGVDAHAANEAGDNLVPWNGDTGNMIDRYSQQLSSVPNGSGIEAVLHQQFQAAVPRRMLPVLLHMRPSCDDVMRVCGTHVVDVWVCTGASSVRPPQV